MTVEDRTRHDRLRSLLPRTFATEPTSSAIGVLLEVLGDTLREVDGLVERALRDRWLRTANGERPVLPSDPPEDDEPLGLPEVALDGHPLPLELLGQALDLKRQPWESDHEAYRNRVRILGPMLAEGLATPRVLLAATLTSLGAEPCPILEKPESNSTRGYGLPPRSLDRCRVCKGGKRVDPDATCPLRSRTIMTARVTDNPRTRAELTRSSLDPAPSLDPLASSGAGRIRVRNDSLFAARPEITLKVPDDAPPDTKLVPSFRSLTSAEEIVLPVVLAPGETLTIRPVPPSNPLPRHEQVWVDLPSGEAGLPARVFVRRESEGLIETEELADLALFAAGVRFDEARFDTDVENGGIAGQIKVAKFARVTRTADTPMLLPGNNDWIFRPLGGATLGSLLTDYQLAPGELGLGSLEFDAATTKVALGLRWWTRPPARFRVRVVRTPAVEQALESGAAELLRQMIDRVRPAGVHPIIDFALEPFVDAVDPEDRFAALAVEGSELVDPSDALALEPGLAEQAEPDEVFGFIGIFDVTRFDISRFADTPILPGEFDVSEFDWSLANPFGPPEPAKFGTTYYDHALLNDEGEEP